MLGLQTHSDETRCKGSETGKADDCAKDKGRLEWAVTMQNMTEHAVGEDLEALGVAYGTFAVVLDSLQIVNGDRA